MEKVRLNTSIKVDTKRKLKKAANDAGMTMNVYIEQLIEATING